MSQQRQGRGGFNAGAVSNLAETRREVATRVLLDGGSVEQHQLSALPFMVRFGNLSADTFTATLGSLTRATLFLQRALFDERPQVDLVTMAPGRSPGRCMTRPRAATTAVAVTGMKVLNRGVRPLGPRPQWPSRDPLYPPII